MLSTAEIRQGHQDQLNRYIGVKGARAAKTRQLMRAAIAELDARNPPTEATANHVGDDS